MKKIKIGILSGGGDAPGINAVIRAVVYKGILYNKYQLVGIKDGWRGLINGEISPLELVDVEGIINLGGSILGTSRTNPLKREGSIKKIFENINNHKINAIIAIGGDDTQKVTYKLYEKGLPCVGVPKTIDNDLVGTDYTFGFNTAVSIATEAIDRIRTTAQAHHRVMIVEVMGRTTGWIALEAGIAGGANIILIPEKPYKIDDICKYIFRRKKRGRNYSLIVVAEGAKLEGEKETVHTNKIDEFGNTDLGGAAHNLRKQIENKTNLETRDVILGHLQRGGPPTAYDRILATRFGVAAIDLIKKRKYGNMVTLKGNKISSIPLKKIIGKRKKVDDKLFEIAKIFFD